MVSDERQLNGRDHHLTYLIVQSFPAQHKHY